MSRPKEVTGGRVKGFRLPAILISQLEAAAALRKVNVSDVVREILERHIQTYYDECQQGVLEHLQERIDVLQDDTELQVIFSKFKDDENFVVPWKIMQDSDRIRLLSVAIDAHKEIEAKRNEKDEVFTPFKKRSVKLLLRLADSAGGKIKELLTNLTRLADSGDLVLSEPGNGTVLFTLSPQLARSIERRQTHIMEVCKLLKLIKQGLLQYPTRTDLGETVYTWTVKKG